MSLKDRMEIARRADQRIAELEAALAALLAERDQARAERDENMEALLQERERCVAAEEQARRYRDTSAVVTEIHEIHSVLPGLPMGRTAAERIVDLAAELAEAERQLEQTRQTLRALLADIPTIRNAGDASKCASVREARRLLAAAAPDTNTPT